MIGRTRSATAIAIAIATVGIGSCSLVFDPKRRAGADPPDLPDADPNRADATHRCDDWGERRIFDPCLLPEPVGEVFLGGIGTWEFDTGTGQLVYLGDDGQPVPALVTAAIAQREGGRSAMVISADRFELGANARLRAFGPLPLIIASWSDLAVSGTIDVSSHGRVGPGANEPDAIGEGSLDGVAGGGGGGLGQAGGSGGSGGAGLPGSGGGRITVGDQLRGGCRGGLGVDTGPGGPGAGGGALLLSAVGEVGIGDALIVAGGEAGEGGTELGGGAGGGSGGMIALEGSTVRVLSVATIEALGGGGGGGGGSSSASDGSVGSGLPGDRGIDGYDPDGAVIPGDGGHGGTGGMSGGDGGDGSRSSQAGAAGKDAIGAGGGGGGGGPGYIVIWGNLTSASPTIRPPANVNPP